MLLHLNNELSCRWRIDHRLWAQLILLCHKHLFSFASISDTETPGIQRQSVKLPVLRILWLSEVDITRVSSKKKLFRIEPEAQLTLNQNSRVQNRDVEERAATSRWMESREVLGPDMVKITEIMAVWVQVDMVARRHSTDAKQILIHSCTNTSPNPARPNLAPNPNHIPNPKC